MKRKDSAPNSHSRCGLFCTYKLYMHNLSYSSCMYVLSAADQSSRKATFIQMRGALCDCFFLGDCCTLRTTVLPLCFFPLLQVLKSHCVFHPYAIEQPRVAMPIETTLGKGSKKFLLCMQPCSPIPNYIFYVKESQPQTSRIWASGFTYTSRIQGKVFAP